MKATDQRSLDALRRSQDFTTSRADVLGGLATSPARQQIDAAVTAVSTHINDQASANRVLVGQMSRQQSLVKDLVTKHMAPISKFARAKLRGMPDVRALTNPARSNGPKPLIHAARSMATTAAPYEAQLVEAGFPADTIAQLTTAADALDAVVAQRAQAKVNRIGATTGITENLVTGREGLKLLNAAISRQFSSDATFLASWRAASRVVANPVRAKTVASATSAASAKPAATAVTPTTTAVSTAPVSAVAPAAAVVALPAQHV